MTYPLGVIEGFFGPPWSWRQRNELISFFQKYENIYRFYIYGPKADDYLRRRWQQDWPTAQWEQLVRLRDAYKQAGVDFGISLAPIELHKLDNPGSHPVVIEKIERLNGLNLDILTIQFDDNHGGMPALAQRQLEIVHVMAEISNARKIIFCPTYYSDDEELVYSAGKMPLNYLEDIGEKLDRSIEIFWTGPVACSKEYPLDHLSRVAGQLQRKPFIWDNYPVNDGPSMYSQLHIGAFKHRPPELQQYTSGWAVNPMNQFYLSLIPLLSLLQSWQQASQYDADQSFISCADDLCGKELATLLNEDRHVFQNIGLKNMTVKQRSCYLERYAASDSPYAKEVLDWLHDKYQPGQDVIDEFTESNLSVEGNSE